MYTTGFTQLLKNQRNNFKIATFILAILKLFERPTPKNTKYALYHFKSDTIIVLIFKVFP